MKTKNAGIKALLIGTIGISALLLFQKNAYFHNSVAPALIFGVSEVADAEYPFMAYIITRRDNTNNAQCGGTLIAPIERGQFLQVGVVGAGHGCSITAEPAFYVDLSNEKVARIISAQKLSTTSNTSLFLGEQNQALLNDELTKMANTQYSLPVYRF